MSTPILRLAIERASAIGPAARAVADTAAALGLSGTQRTQLEALLSEALGAIVQDSFDGAEDVTIDIAVAHDPGHVEVVVHQRGAPSTYVSGRLPSRLETLVNLGYADSVAFVSEGVHGSELHIGQSLSTGGLVADSAFVADTGADEQRVPIEDLVIRAITPDDVIEVARLYFRTYGYTKIGSPWLYEPDVFRHKLAEGLHPAVVAVTPTGRVVGHAGVLRSTPESRTVAGGPLAVEPAYRQHGLTGRMGVELMPMLAGLDLRGMYSEAVTAHAASQKACLNVGGSEVALVLGRQPADLEFLGFDGPSGFRRAVMVFYTPSGNREEATSHVPPRYRAIVERIYERAGMPRRVVSDLGRPPADLPAASRFSTQLTAETKFARIDVEAYGADFVNALQGLMQQLGKAGFEVIAVHLRMTDPLTAYFGAGLGELGLSFNGIFPEQDDGDHLALGICFDLQDPDTIAFASDFGEELKAYVLEDRHQIIGGLEARARSRASVARILDSL